MTILEWIKVFCVCSKISVAELAVRKGITTHIFN